MVMQHSVAEHDCTGILKQTNKTLTQLFIVFLLKYSLGKDERGWSMYIDHQRSWFLHNNVHSNRTEGGIDVGSTVGVLLDLDRHQLSYFVNEEPQVIRGGGKSCLLKNARKYLRVEKFKESR